MKLACTHCDRYDAAPLSAVPPAWTDFVPLYRPLEVAPGVAADHLGCCPACDRWRKAAFVPPLTEATSEPQLSFFSQGNQT